MSNGTDENTNFGKADGVDLQCLFDAKLDALSTLVKGSDAGLRLLIDANDKNYNQRFDNVIQATKNALEASDRAVSKAESAAEKRFDAVNEFRATLADQQRTLMPRSEIEIMVRNLSDRVDSLAQSDVLRAGQKSGFQEGWGMVVGVIALIVAVVAIVARFI